MGEVSRDLSYPTEIVFRLMCVYQDVSQIRLAARTFPTSVIPSSSPIKIGGYATIARICKLAYFMFSAHAFLRNFFAPDDARQEWTDLTD